MGCNMQYSEFHSQLVSIYFVKVMFAGNDLTMV